MTAATRRTLAVTIEHDSDVGIARLRAQDLARTEGLPEVAGAAFATAVSELARNVLVHARSGRIELGTVVDHERRGVVATARDDGPGIADVESAMVDGYSTAGTLGLGLPSVQRLVDEIQLHSVVGVGTTVTVRKWKP